MTRFRLIAAAAIASAVNAAAPVYAAEPTPPPTSSAQCPAGDPSTSQFLSAPTVHVRAPGGRLSLVIASDGAARARGLMCVVSVPHGRGMLFAFTAPDRPQNFWMKDTLVPLDMVFVSGSGIVGSVAADVPATPEGVPDSAIARRNGLARYVIELGAGDAARYGIVSGTHLAIPPVPAAS